MKKALLVVVILSIFAFTAFGQEIKPFRIAVGMDGPLAAEFTYALPIDSISLAFSGGVAYGQGFGWIGKATFYPFNPIAKGWFASIGVRSTGYTDVFVGAGYQFLFWNWLSLQLAFNVGYNLNGEIYPGTGSSFSFPPALLLGVAF